MKPREKYIRRKDDRNLRALNIVTCARAIDAISQTLRNIDVEHLDKATRHLHRALDYLIEYRCTSEEIWNRYRKKAREARVKTQKIKEFYNSNQSTLNLEIAQDTGGWTEYIFHMEDSEFTTNSEEEP